MLKNIFKFKLIKKMVNEKKTESSKTLEQNKNTPVKETGADSNKEAASSKQPAKPVVEDEDLVIFIFFLLSFFDFIYFAFKE